MTRMIYLAEKWRLRDDRMEEQPPLETVAMSNRLRVKRGEKAPVDGRVLEGLSLVDGLIIIGEPVRWPRRQRLRTRLRVFATFL